MTKVALAFAALSLLSALAACGGDDDASETASNGPTTFVSGTATPTVTVTAVPTATVVGMAPAEIADFRTFAAQVSEAILGHNNAFFTSRARPVQVTCRGDEQLGPCSGKVAGDVQSGIPGGAWRSDASTIFTLDKYAANLQWYWLASLPAASDEYGSGDLRLFALAWSPAKDTPVFRVITTSIVNTYPTGSPISENQREAHIFNFERQGTDWAFISEIAAPMSVSSSDWLSGQCSECYDYFEPWQGATN